MDMFIILNITRNVYLEISMFNKYPFVRSRFSGQYTNFDMYHSLLLMPKVSIFVDRISLAKIKTTLVHNMVY